jgi:uncharacterized protein (TIGR00297 family)
LIEVKALFSGRFLFLCPDWFSFKQMNADYLVIVLLMLAALVAVFARKLTPVAGLTGLLISILIYLGSGYAGLLSMAAFFICGTMATGWKLNIKAQKGISENNKGQRNASQVLANSGMAAIVSVVGYFFGADGFLIAILTAAAFSAATADTLSSELGNIYGKRYYNILSLKPDQRGLDGVISLEGTLAGVAGSLLIAMICFAFFPFAKTILIILIAGTAGNIADSILGAALERRGKIKNDAVNFLNTATGVLIAFLLM